MAFQYTGGSVTKALKSLAEVVNTANEKLSFWKGLDNDELKIQQKDMKNLLMMIEAKKATLDKAMDKFTKEADDLPETDQQAQNKADEIIAKVINAVDEANTTKDFLDLELLRSKEDKNGSPSHQVTNQRTSTEFRKDFPKVPKFKGEVWQFENFWNLFQEIHGNSSETDLIKFNFLLNSLEGEPKELMSRYKITGDNYQKAVEHLKSKYNNREEIVSELTTQLQRDTAKTGSITDQRKLFERIYIITEQLKDFKENIETRMFKDEVVQKFSKKIQEEVFKKKLEMTPDKWTLDQILKDLEITISKEEELNKLLKKPDSDSQEIKSKKPNSKKDSTLSEKPKPKCTFCKKEGHWGSDCKTVPNPKDRLEILKAEERCQQCTRTGHAKESCRGKPCSKCGKNHHFSVCFSKKQEASEKKNQNTEETTKKVQTKTTATTTRHESHTQRDGRDAFIPTIKVIAYNPKEKLWTPISVMLDTGADQSYITQSLFESWNLPDEGTNTIKHRVFGAANTDIKTTQKTSIKIQIGEEEINMNVLTSVHIAGKIPKSSLSKEDMVHIMKNHLSINEDVFERTSQPQGIIGCDYLPKILTGKIVPLPSGLSLIDTMTGYTTMGSSESENKKIEEKHLYIVVKDTETDPIRTLECDQKRDTLLKAPDEYPGPVKEEKAEDDKKTLDFFKRTVEKRDEGYFVRLPYKEKHPPLPDNFAITFKRLQSVKKQFSHEVIEMMDKIIQDQLEKNILEEASQANQSGLIHYNGIQPVITPHKKTTKCRVVVDGSAHFKNQPSLNDVLKQGPLILTEIVHLLIRLRAGKTIIVSIVEKAFLQVFLHEEDRDVTRILWLKDITMPVTKDNIVELRFTRVLFGLNASPFLLAATIMHHLEKHPNQSLAKEIADGLYVDNLILTLDGDHKAAIELYHQLKSLFKEMNMNLREFQSNSNEFKENTDPQDRAEEKCMKILGIPWDSEKDEIITFTMIEENEKNTRRTVSSAVASTFDPLGMVSPLILPLKLFQRGLWNEAYQWDTPLSREDEEKWTRLISDFNKFSHHFPRHVVDKTGKNVLVTFTDASKDATCCCIYIANNMGTHLLFSKSKVKPLKESWTIPKLETVSLFIGTEWTLEILKALQTGNITVTRTIILTDSSIALDWLKSHPGKKEIGCLLTRRLDKIREAANEMEQRQVEVDFGHVRSQENPADIGTRGATKDTLKDSIWFNGPDFLKNPISEWTQHHDLFKVNDTKIHHILATVYQQEDSSQEEEQVSDPPKGNRYNLRKRKNLDYNEETVNRGSFSVTNLVPTQTLLCLMLMMMITGATTQSIAVKCNSQGLQIQGSYKTFEACSENYCTDRTRVSWNLGGKKDIWLPPAIKIHDHHNTIKVNDGTEMKVFELDCPAVPFCETIDCTFCLTNILNPECHMSFAILGLGALIFGLLMIIHIICNVPVALGDPIRMLGRILQFLWKILCYSCITLCAMWARRRQPRSRWREMVVIVTFIIVWKTTESCQEVDILSQFETVCDQKGKCQTLTEEVLTLNDIHREGCIRIGKNGTVLRDIRIELVEIELHCTKRSITYTQDIVTKVWSSKRCPTMGSCQGEKCNSITRSSKIPELDAVNHYVGNTGCSESCGGAGCGCFYLSSGCLFYRIYAEPKNEESLEIFQCTEYTPLAKLKISVTTLNSYKNTMEKMEILNPIGRTTTFMQVALTVDSIQTPPSTVLNNWYIRTNKSTAIWPQNQLPPIQCDPLMQKCSFQEQCNCNPAEDRMRCTCKDVDIAEHFKRTDAHLPVQQGSWRIEAEEDSIRGRIRTSSTTTLTLKMNDKWKTSIVKTTEHCTASNTAIKGCYNCASGATAEITCYSRNEETMANVECEDKLFTVPCSIKGSSTNISFSVSKAKFQRICTLDCGGKRVEVFEISGILKYSGSIWTSVYHLLTSNTTVYNEINIPDLKHIADGYLTYMKTVCLVVLGTGLVFLLTYSIITQTGLSILRGTLQLTLTVLLGCMNLVIFLICWPVHWFRKTNGRHEHMHLHVAICMLSACLIGSNHCSNVTETMPRPREFVFQKMMANYAGKAKAALEIFEKTDNAVRDEIREKNNIITAILHPFNKDSNQERTQFERLLEVRENLIEWQGFAVSQRHQYQETLKMAKHTAYFELWDINAVAEYLNDQGINEASNLEWITRIQSTIHQQIKEVGDVVKQKEQLTPHLLEEMEKLSNGVMEKMDDIRWRLFNLEKRMDKLTGPPGASPNGDQEVDQEVDQEFDHGIDQEGLNGKRTQEEVKNMSSNRATSNSPRPRTQRGHSKAAQPTRYLTQRSFQHHIHCALCTKGHYTNECGYVPNIKERRRLIRVSKRCKKCLNKKFEDHQCNAKTCQYCGSQTHNKALCEEPRNIEV